MNNRDTGNRIVFTGYKELDDMTGGFRPGELAVIASRPAMGKTALSLNFLRHAVEKGKKCLYFSLEMTAEQLLQRYISADTGAETEKLITGNLTETEKALVGSSTERFQATGSRIIDTPAISVSEIREKCRDSEPDLVIIDYLQIMGTGTDTRYFVDRQDVADISCALKALAFEMTCPVLVLSQLSRACEGRTDKHPMLSDFLGSEAIVQAADLVMFLYRDEYYHPDTGRKGEAEVIIAKQINGPTGTVKLTWQPETARFIPQV